MISTEDSSSALENYMLARDRARRQGKIPQKYAEGYLGFALLAAEDGGPVEPQDYTAAVKDHQSKEWSEAMIEEMDSLYKNNTWVVVPKPATRKVIGCRWIYKRKPGIPGVEQARFKARLVAKGYSQREGIDYNEIFSPVVKHVTIRLLLSLVVQFELELEQLDVKTTFLHGDLEEELYMEQPEGFIEKGREDQVCLLKKSLYGLKQSPRQWNQKFNEFMVQIGFVRSKRDQCAFVKQVSAGEYVYLLLYVDDMLVAARNMDHIRELKAQLNSAFEMKDLGPAKRILGIDILRNRSAGTLKLSQGSYLEKVLETFGMSTAKAVTSPMGSHFKLCAATEAQKEKDEEYMSTVPYSSVVGSLMYSMIGTRPDLAYPVGLISRYMSCPVKQHWEAVKWVLRYVRGSVELGLQYKRGTDFRLQGFCDADYASDHDRRRSITGYTFKAGENVISWKSGLQKVVALSTTESEYMSLTEAVKEGVWLMGLFEDFGLEQEAVEIFCDSQSALALARNNVHHERTKHIDVRLHFIRDMIEFGKVKVQKIHTSVNPADIFTKVLPTSRFRDLLALLGVQEH